MTYSDDDVAAWTEFMWPLHESIVRSEDARDVDEATANWCSGTAVYSHLPHRVAEMVERAIGIGYAQALHDVRDGSVGGLGLLEDDQ
jgi:hypothetical protein